MYVRHKKVKLPQNLEFTFQGPSVHLSNTVFFFSIVTLKFLRHFVLICAAPRSSRLKSTAAAVHPVPVTTLKPVYDSIYMAAHYLF